MGKMQILSLIGAAIVLFGYLGAFYGNLDKEGFLYAFLNFLGAGILGITALEPLNPGLVIVEGIWSATNLGLCFKAYKRKYHWANREKLKV